METQFKEFLEKAKFFQSQFEKSVEEFKKMNNKMQEIDEKLDLLQLKFDSIEANQGSNQPTKYKYIEKKSNEPTTELVLSQRIKYLEEKLKNVSVEFETDENDTEISPKILDEYDQNDYCLSSIRDTSVVIYGLTDKKHTKESLKKVVIMLAGIMSANLTENDIVDTFIVLDRTNSGQFKQMAVQFKTTQNKQTFLANASNLALYPFISHFILREFPSRYAAILFNYAKLLQSSYSIISCENNKVYHRSTITDKRIQITDEKHVDDLIKKNAASVALLNFI